MTHASETRFRTLAVRLFLSLIASGGLALSALNAEALECPEGKSPPLGTVIEVPDEVISVHLDGDRAYVLRSSCAPLTVYAGYALSIHHVSNSAAPAHLGSVSFFDILCPDRLGLSFAVEGGIAYVASPSVFHVIDVTDPADPHEVGALTAWSNQPGCIAVAEGRAYVGDATGLRVFDVADPTAPALLGSVALSAKAVSLTLSRSFAYVGTIDARVAVVDVSNPLSLMVVTTIALPGTPWDIEIRGSHAYVSDGESGLQILDVSRPAQPRLVGGADTPGEAHRVTVGGARAYVVDWGTSPGDERYGLRVIDIANPTRPRMVNSIAMVSPRSRSVRDVSMSQGRVAVGGATPHPPGDCAGGPCTDVGYVRVMHAIAYEAPPPCVSHRWNSTTAESDASVPAVAVPTAFRLLGNEPNPFDRETSIRFEVPRTSRVCIRLYDARGRRVRTLVDGALPPGRHEVAWRAHNERGQAVGPGIYFLVMEAESFQQTRKITLLK